VIRMGVEQRTVVVTGATGGLGKFVTHHLAELGARLVLVGTDSNKLDELGNGLPQSYKDWLAVPVDLIQPDSAEKVFQAALARFGQVEVLLHFVGGWIGGKPLVQVQAEDITSMLQQHLWSTFYLAQAFVPHMLANGWGRLVVVSSPSVTATPANRSPYTIGKSAQEALMMTLANELAGSHVTANALRVKTIDVEHARDRQPTSANRSWTTPEEIVAALLYLCSDEGQAVNGARIPLYGSN
jgi:NAD(P)-dependent dehydrogenase (short-subunit alcohol dehydrogenase family)